MTLTGGTDAIRRCSTRAIVLAAGLLLAGRQGTSGVTTQHASPPGPRAPSRRHAPWPGSASWWLVGRMCGAHRRALL